MIRVSSLGSGPGTGLLLSLDAPGIVVMDIVNMLWVHHEAVMAALEARVIKG